MAIPLILIRMGDDVPGVVKAAVSDAATSNVEVSDAARYDVTISDEAVITVTVSDDP